METRPWVRKDLRKLDEATRAEFQKRREPGQRRTATNVGVDTYRPLIPTPEFAKMAG